MFCVKGAGRLVIRTGFLFVLRSPGDGSILVFLCLAAGYPQVDEHGDVQDETDCFGRVVVGILGLLTSRARGLI